MRSCHDDSYYPYLLIRLLSSTNPGAREWYVRKLDALIDLGVDCFKASSLAPLLPSLLYNESIRQTDFGERIPHANVKYFDGSDPRHMHNSYSVLYNELVFNLLEKRFGKHEAVVFARAASTGGQRFPVVN